MISADTIRTIAANNSIHPGVIEKDYVLSKTLMALAAIPEFPESLVFKGGTALKKCYYPNWRYSEDLDFTARHKLDPSQIQDMFRQTVEAVSSTFGLPLRVIEYSQYPKTGDKLTSAQLKLGYDGPLRKASGQKNNIRVDIAFDEKIVSSSNSRLVHRDYTDDIDARLSVYSLEEIVAEKLRSILQRGKSRDYYDVWILLKRYKKDIVIDGTLDILKKKCEFKGITFPVVEDFFTPDRVNEAAPFWERGLAHQVDNLPTFESVLLELRELLIKVLKG
jgi:predicted nucleotidyltransferase component of viral defense system